MKTRLLPLVLIFITACILRFHQLKESTYFGFDEARDAYISQEIYKTGDLRIIGPPANAPNLFHGPLYWYLIGPLYIVGKGNPYFVSFAFRLLNAFGVFAVYWLGKKYFNRSVGILSALLYAFSFEENQYAIYALHPSLTIFSWLAIFSGAVIILKNEKSKFWGLPLIFAGAASAIQFELVSISAAGTAIVLLLMLRKKVKSISWKSWLTAMIFSLIFLGSYLLAEVKFNFRSIKSALNLVGSGWGVMETDDNKFSMFIRRFILLFHDNIIPLNGLLIYFTVALILLLLFVNARKNKNLIYILIWISSGLFLLPLGGYNAYYINAGIGIGVIIAVSFLLEKIIAKRKILSYLLLSLIIVSNFYRTIKQKDQSLIVDIKPQPYMKLADEERLIDRMYLFAEGKGFTIRTINIPYKVQTVWAYLFENYGLKKYGYLPYYETGMVEGFPGKLPVPVHGSTCIRFLIQEPARGIPDRLIDQALEEENLFSKIESKEHFGHFKLEIRSSLDEDCHNLKPSN